MKIFFLITMKLSQRLCEIHYESSAETCPVLKIVSLDPFSIRMYKPVLFHAMFCLLFTAYLEEQVKTMVTVMFPILYVLLLSYCIPIGWKGIERIVRATHVNRDVVKLLLLFMLGFLFIIQRDLQIWFMLYSSLVNLYHMIGSKKSERNVEIRFGRSSWKVELYEDIHRLKVLQKCSALTMRTKCHRPMQHQGVLTLTEQ